MKPSLSARLAWNLWSVLGCVLLSATCSDSRTPSVFVGELTCEYRSTPMGLNTQAPRFGWIITSRERGISQQEYVLLVASSKGNLDAGNGDVWDSGMVDSSDNIQVVYGGNPLEPYTRYWWKVRIRDNHGRMSTWSEPSWFETGPPDDGTWGAQWIGDGDPAPENDEDFYNVHPAPLFRREFTVNGTIADARLIISGLGYYEAYINGGKVGDHVLDPGWTDYEDRVYYVIHDVTGMVHEGANAVGIMLGNGWYNPLPLRLFGTWNLREILEIGRPKVLAQLRLTYNDGTTETIVTDTDWKAGDGPYLKNNVYLGEVYDARKTQPGWSRPGYDDSGWKQAVGESAPPGRLMVQEQPPIRITRTVEPVALTEPEPEIYIYDLGQNFAGWIRYAAQGPAGTEIRFRYGELLHEDGTLNVIPTVACQIRSPGRGGPGAPDIAWQEDTFILSGDDMDTFTQKFGFHGFRYVEVTGHPGTPELDDLTGLRLSADLERVGRFASSSGLFNRIQEMCDWTFLSNVFSIESDCPGREKFGYGGDIVTAGEAFIANYDMSTFYTKTVNDFADTRTAEGGLTECAPNIGINSRGLSPGTGPVGWTLAHPFMQEQLYRYYGNRRLIGEQYDITRGLVDFIHERVPEHVIGIGISDHESVAPRPVAVTSTAFYYHHVRALASFADLLGKPEDAEKYGALAEDIRRAFVDTFLDNGTGRVIPYELEEQENGDSRARIWRKPAGDGGETPPPTQASQIFALYYDLLPESERENALRVLLDDINTENNGHLTTGIFATKMLFDLTDRLPLAEAAGTIARQCTYPSWGYMLENGGTTLWESWRIRDISQNHPMFGSVSEWFIQGLAGISPHPDACGFDRIVIRPQAIEGLDWVTGSYRSIRGMVSSEWRREDGRFELDVEIPCNTSGRVYVPAPSMESVKESGIAAGNAEGVTIVGMDGGYVVFDVGSGRYAFTVDGR